jgi:uncharacterized protein (TIGR03437 family)
MVSLSANKINGGHMKKLPVIALLCVISSTLSAETLRIVNAASLTSGSVSPGSIISIFGTNLTKGVASATDVQTPPTALGGVTVTIGATPAALFYVSPTQINAVVGPSTTAGVQIVTITSESSTQTGSVTIDVKAAPGLFALTGAGTRDGAILNAITFLLGDFSTRTAGSPTYLALFATGVNTTTKPTVTIGGVPVTVTFAGAAPCCAGLQQVNVQLPDSLAGAGRVPVVLTSSGQTSNTVQVVLLPPQSSQPMPSAQANQSRSRELASLAAVPGTSLVLSVDENDDVVRVIDVSTKQVKQVIVLASGANPGGVAVNTSGTVAVVAETGRNKVAILDLAKFTVTAEVATGNGPVNVAIAGTQAIVVNADEDSATAVDLTTLAHKTLAVGRGPAGVAVDATARKAYVTNENDGTISVIELVGVTVAQTLSLGASVRPEAIALVPSTSIAFVTQPAAGPDGQVLLVDLSTGSVTSTISANPDRSGGSTDLAFFKSKMYFANQAGGSVSVLPLTAAGAASGAVTTIKVDLGARALAIDVKDNLLVVSNEGTGTLVLVDLATNNIVGRITAVQTGLPGDDGDDDHSDRKGGANAPTIAGISPLTAKAGATVTLTVSGTNLSGATALTFTAASSLLGNGHGQGDDKGKGHGDDGGSGKLFGVTSIQVNAAGNALTATVAIDSSTPQGAYLVRVDTPNGETTQVISAANTFTVLP